MNSELPEVSVRIMANEAGVNTCSRSRGAGRRASWLAVLAWAALAGGCIERTVTINTEPQGATVYLNDDEVGKSPVKVPFTWYGDYDLIIRKSGYKTIRTHHNLQTPWYEVPGIDIFTECMIPFTVHDDRVAETYALEPQQLPDRDTLLKSADEARTQALSEGR